MFTGIIQGVGTVLQVDRGKKEGTITLRLPSKFKIRKGGSIAVNGACLTARSVEKDKIVCDCMAETFRLTTLGDLIVGDKVNLELPLTLQTPIGGHLVQGHVDGVGKIVSITQEGKSKVLKVAAPSSLRSYLIKKGSVTLDGVSLTLVKTDGHGFSVALIPMTLQETTLGRKKVGGRVNIEVDLIAKQLEALLEKKLR